MILGTLLALTVGICCSDTVGHPLEPERWEILYRVEMLSDTLRGASSTVVDTLTLQVGERYTSQSYTSTLRCDSMEEDSVSFEDLASLRLRYFETKDPEAYAMAWPRISKRYLYSDEKLGQYIAYIHDHIVSLTYSEPIESPKWVQTDSLAVIAGYPCRQATADYRGRRWLVWYFEDVSLSLGPWKLRGLPGLVVYARDSQGHYTYRLISVASDTRRPIRMHLFGEGKPQEIERKEYLRAHMDYMSGGDPSRISLLQSLFRGERPLSEVLSQRFHAIRYDELERDYR